MDNTNFDMTKVKLKRCVKCKRSGQIHRHHKGNDRILSRVSARIAANYHLFKNCVDLCKDCHAMIHIIYFERIEWGKYQSVGELQRAFITLCNQWLASKDNLGVYIPPEVINHYHNVQRNLSSLGVYVKPN